MTLFDLSVLLFFAVATLKVVVETTEYWRAYDLAVNSSAVSKESVRPNPKHISAPVRRSPANPNFRTEPRPMQVAQTAKRPTGAKTTRVAHPAHTNRKVRPAAAAAKKTKIAA